MIIITESLHYELSFIMLILQEIFRIQKIELLRLLQHFHYYHEDDISLFSIETTLYESNLLSIVVIIIYHLKKMLTSLNFCCFYALGGKIYPKK